MPKISVQGLKCDNPNCDWVDMSILYKEYKDKIGMKCPKCGEVVLTEADYKTTRLLVGLSKFISIFTWPFEKRKKQILQTKISMNGSGIAKFSEPKMVDNPFYKKK
jgi:hypothetical protein